MARMQTGAPARLMRLQERIEQWRRHRDSRAMPEALWEAAASLARRQGVSQVARALGLHYSALKRRAAGRGRESGRGRRHGIGFIDLGSAPWPGRAAASESPAVELWGADGCRLVIRFDGGLSPELRELAVSLWKQR